MGQVYRATDTNLRRQVAIKVLPESVAGDAERLARFQREAEVLASLVAARNISGASWGADDTIVYGQQGAGRDHEWLRSGRAVGHRGWPVHPKQAQLRHLA